MWYMYVYMHLVLAIRVSSALSSWATTALPVCMLTPRVAVDHRPTHKHLPMPPVL